MSTRPVTAFSFFLPLRSAAAAQAGLASTDVIVPVVGIGSGIDDAQFRARLWITNSRYEVSIADLTPPAQVDDAHIVSSPDERSAVA